MQGRQDRRPTGEINTWAYRGVVVYIYAFDLAYDMKRERLVELLGQPLQYYLIGLTKRSPKNVFFYRPQMVRLPPEIRQGPISGTVEIQRTVKLFSVGAISIQVRVPFEVGRIQDLVGYHDLSFAMGSLEGEITKLAERIRKELEPYCVRPVSRLGQVEAYTVFCIDTLLKGVGTLPVRTEDWLMANRREVAGLLTEEDDVAHLSEQEVAESTEQYLTYYDNDLAVVDWDAALVIGKPDSFDEVLHIMELANVQLVELAAYDRVLDSSLDAVYRDLARRRVRTSREVQRNLREIRVDSARLSDELLNITKFFGDWHLAKVYRNLSSRFHLADWHGIIREKLKTLGDLYQLLNQDWINYWMVILEATIVLLFIVDVVLLIAGL